MKGLLIMIVNGVSEGVETRNMAEAILEEILAKNFPKLTEDINPQNQEGLWIWSRIIQREPCSVKSLETKC